MLRKSLKFFAALIIGLLAFIWAVKTVGWKTIPAAFSLFLSLKGLAILGITFLASLSGFLRWKTILRKVSGRYSFPELFKIWLASFTVSYLLTPIAFLGGEPFRAYLSKKKYKLSWEKSAAAVIIDRLLEWTVFLIFTIAGVLFFIFLNTANLNIYLILSSSVLVLSLFVLLVIFYAKSLKKESVLKWLLKVLKIKRENFESSQNGKLVFKTEKEVVNFFFAAKRQFWQGIAFSFLKYFFCFFRVALLVVFLQKGVNFFQTAAIYGISNLALFVPVPAALGSMEASGILGFSGLGFNIASGTIFAIVIRNADIIMSLIGGVFLLKISLSLAGAKILEFLERNRFFFVEDDRFKE